MGCLLWQHEHNKRKPCIWLLKSGDKPAQTLLKDQKGIQLVDVFPKQVSNNREIWNGSEVMQEYTMAHLKMNLYECIVFLSAYMSQHYFNRLNKAF